MLTNPASCLLQLEFFAEDEGVTIVPYFSLDTESSTLKCIGVSLIIGAASEIDRAAHASMLLLLSKCVWRRATMARFSPTSQSKCRCGLQ